MPPRYSNVLNRQARKNIYDLTQYMKEEKENGVKDVNNVYLRVANATGVSRRTVHRIANEGSVLGLVSVFRTPGKKRSSSKPITNIDNFDQGVMKRCIHNFHKTEKEMPNMNNLLAKFKRDINFKGSKTSLKTVITNFGFKWRKTETNRKVLLKKTDIRLKRILYLRAIKKYRDEGRPIVYTDESYAHSSHTKGITVFITSVHAQKFAEPMFRTAEIDCSYCTSTAKLTRKKWESVVGLEVHAQLDTESKLFSGAENTFGGVVNNCVSLFDAAIPGTLPVLNRRCVELGIMTALALSCRVNEVSTFDRKHYFYADLPTGYQITQQRAPLASDGLLSFQVYSPGVHKKPYKKSSKIKQIQLEQDSGKSLHDAELRRSLIDLNRAGAPLIELVFEPDLEDGEEAAALVKELVLIVQRLGACSGRMEEGALRVDANVSLRRPGDPLSTRTEIKNIGSIRGVAGAVKHEIERQRVVLEGGGRIVNETRSWDAVARVTIPMRDKEVVQDYRYMPEPNLPPLRVNLKTKEDSQDVISVPLVKDTIPELPEETRVKLMENFNLRTEYAIQLVNEPILLDYFLEVTSNERNPTKVTNLLLNELLTVLNKRKLDVEDCPITIEQMKETVDLLLDHKISLEICKKLLDELVGLSDSDLSPGKIVEEKNWLLMSDEEEIKKTCMDVLDSNPKLVKQYREGKTKVFKAFLGIVIKNSQNKIDMSVASKVMEELLKKL